MNTVKNASYPVDPTANATLITVLLAWGAAVATLSAPVGTGLFIHP